MAFIREKNGYHYLVESRRRAGKVRQTVVAYLGEWDTVQDALTGLPGQIAKWRNVAEKARARAESIKAKCEPHLNGQPVPRSDRLRYGYYRNRDYRRYWWFADHAAAASERADAMERRLEHLRTLP